MYKENMDGKHPSSAVCEHMLETGHRFPLNQTKILCQEDNTYTITFKHRIQEVLHIYHHCPTLNRDWGYEMPTTILIP